MTESEDARNPVARGALVIVTLGAPREKFWGEVVNVSTAGISVAGADLNSFDHVVRALRTGEPSPAGVVFFPMHRVERVELDAGVAGLPSLRERFEASSGTTIRSWLS